MVVAVRKLIWDEKNSKHMFAKHTVVPEEVEEVCQSDPLVLTEHSRRLALVGTTTEGKILKVILQPKGKGAYYPITAYVPDKHELSLYTRLKGGENNEK